MIEDNPYRLVLHTPVVNGKETIDCLTLREPTAKELRNLKITGEMKFGDLLDLGQVLTEQTRRVIDSLSSKDAFALVAKVGFLLEAGSSTMS